jgi:hypothetical protein
MTENPAPIRDAEADDTRVRMSWRALLSARVLKIIGRFAWLIGLIVVIAAIALSWYASMTAFSDAPDPDHLFSLTLLAGLSLMAIGATIYAASMRRTRTAIGHHARKPLIVFSLAAVTVLISVYLFNPLLSPVAFLRDSDLDGVQDYDDEYPHDSSRIDYPWVSWGIVIYCSVSNDEWNLSILEGVHSFWLDATAIEILNPDNTTGFERTILSDMSEEMATGGIQYFNNGDVDQLDRWDFFHIDRNSYGPGSKFLIWGYTGGYPGWECYSRDQLSLPV